MDEKLQIVQHLYGEAADRSAYHRLLEDEAVRAAYQAMSEVKFRLDHRPRQRPDAVVLDRILAAASGEASVAGGALRPDRPALRLVSRRAFQWVGMAAAAVLVVGVGLMALWPDEEPASVAPAVAQEQTTMPEGPASESYVPSAAMQTTADQTPAWDEADEVRRLHRQIGMLQRGNADLRWGEPVVPLEMLNGMTSRDTGVRPARSRQRPDGY